jgi:hypothetical protein
MSIPTFVYRPLEEQQIRILEIFPGSENYPISRSLRPSDFGSGAKYEAVSYSWGTGSSARNLTILIDGCSIQVTANLKAALKVFRREILSSLGEDNGDLNEISKQLQKVATDDPSLKRLLWMDALCINQQDNDKRNHQIQLMRTVYSQSIKLVVWLGEKSDDSDLAIDTAAEIISTIRKSENGLKPWLEQQPTSSLITKSCALAKLFFRPWCSCAWILQEYVVTSKTEAIFYCERKKITGTGMKELFNAVDDILDNLYEQEQAALDCLPAYGDPHSWLK